MSESKVAVTEGSGKNLRTWDRTVSAVLVQEQYVLHAEPAVATYIVSGGNISTATSASQLFAIQAGSSNHVRIHGIEVTQSAAAGSTTRARVVLYRLTTAGSGGTTMNVFRPDNGEASAGMTAQTLPSSKGTLGTYAGAWNFTLTTAPASGYLTLNFAWDRLKPIIIPAGTSNGLALSLDTGIASATVDVVVYCSETAYL